MTIGNDGNLFTVEEVAAMLHRSKCSIRGAAKTGKLAYYQDGRRSRIYFTLKDINRYLERCRQEN